MKKQLILMLTLLILIACHKKNSDTLTRASPKKEVRQKIVAIDTCRVIGTVAGLNGTIIEYDNKITRGGDILERSGAIYLYEKGIRKIFSISPTDVERAFCQELNLKLIEIPYQKVKGPGQKILDLLIREVGDQPQECYIHCIGGANRAGSLIAYYRRHIDGWDYESALSEFKAMGGSPGQYPALVEYLKEL